MGRMATLEQMVEYYNYDKEKALGAVGMRSVDLDAAFSPENTHGIYSAYMSMRCDDAQLNKRAGDFMRLLCAARYTETRDNKEALSTVVEHVRAWKHRYVKYDFKKFYKNKKDISSLIGRTFNKATMLTEFGMLYPKNDNDIAQKDADNRNEFLPELVGIVRLIAEVTVLNANEARIEWMLDDYDFEVHDSFMYWCQLDSYESRWEKGSRGSHKPVRNEQRQYFAFDSKIGNSRSIVRDFFAEITKRTFNPDGGDFSVSYPNVGFMPRYDHLHDDHNSSHKFPWASSLDRENFNYGCLDAVEMLQIAVKIGYVDENTMSLKTNPKTELPYCKRDMGNDTMFEFSAGYREWLSKNGWFEGFEG